jgi:hypothetical protein
MPPRLHCVGVICAHILWIHVLVAATALPATAAALSNDYLSTVLLTPCRLYRDLVPVGVFAPQHGGGAIGCAAACAAVSVQYPTHAPFEQLCQVLCQVLPASSGSSGAACDALKTVVSATAVSPVTAFNASFHFCKRLGTSGFPTSVSGQCWDALLDLHPSSTRVALETGLLFIHVRCHLCVGALCGRVFRIFCDESYGLMPWFLCICERVVRMILPWLFNLPRMLWPAWMPATLFG